jgi:hypothetical protein
MLLRRTEPYLLTHRSGWASSYACKWMTNTRSMYATTLASLQPEVFMGCWRTPEQTFSVAMVLAHLQSGLTTTSFFEFHALTCQITTLNVPFGTVKYSPMGAVGRMAVAYGMGERFYQMARRRNLMRIAAPTSMTYLSPPPALPAIAPSPMLTRTSIGSPGTLEYAGWRPNLSPLGWWCPILVSSGTWIPVSSTCLLRRRRNTWLPLQSGRRGAPTTSKHRNCTGSSCTLPWSFLLDAPTSPAWRPCWEPSTIILSYHAPHPGTHKATWDGGSNSSISQSSQDPIQHPNPLSTTRPTQMQAPGSVWSSLSAKDGVHGSSLLGGNPRAGTSNRPKPLVLSYSPSVYVQYLAKASTSGSMGTIRELSRAGGRNAVPISPPTTFSVVSSSYRRNMIGLYTQDTSRVPRTPQMPPQEVVTLPVASSLNTSPSPLRSNPSLLMSDTSNILRAATIKHTVCAWESINVSSGAKAREPKQWKPLDARPHPIPIPPTTKLPEKRPTPYPQNLTPAPSELHPHCLARDHLRQWLPPPECPTTFTGPAISIEEREQVKDTMVHTWEEDTRTSYGSGLLMWHCFCDAKGMLESEQALATQGMLSAFVAHLATAYSGRTIACYLSGIQGWHILHSIPCALEKREMDAMLCVVDKLTPASSKRKK